MTMSTRSDWRSASGAKPRLTVRFSIWITIVAMLQLMGNQAMPQLNCNVVRMAEEYVRTHFPFIPIGSRRWSSSLNADLWTVRLELPDGHLGFVPEITINERACQVVGAKVWQ